MIKGIKYQITSTNNFWGRYKGWFCQQNIIDESYIHKLCFRREKKTFIYLNLNSTHLKVNFLCHKAIPKRTVKIDSLQYYRWPFLFDLKPNWHLTNDLLDCANGPRTFYFRALSWKKETMLVYNALKLYLWNSELIVELSLMVVIRAQREQTWSVDACTIII